MEKPRSLQKLAKRLKQLREKAGLTQEEFAERAGMDYKFYQRIEANRKADIRLSTLERIAAAYRISLATLFHFR